MSILNRNQILSVQDLPEKIVPVPEWKTPGSEEIPSVKIRCINGLQRQAWFEAMKQVKDDVKDNDEAFAVRFRGELTPLFLSMTLVDEQNQPIFTKEEATLILQKNPAVIDRLFEAARDLCGMSAKEQDTLEKN